MVPIPCGLIGTGNHGMRYFRHLISEETGGQLVAVCRRNIEQGQELAREHNLQFYSDYRDLVCDPAIQAVLIVTPPSLNLPIAVEAIKQGKIVLLEKPLALSYSEGKQILDAANQAAIPLMTAHTLRYEPAIRTLQEMKVSLGHLEYLACTMRFNLRPSSPDNTQAWRQHGVLMEFGIHLLDLVRILTQDEIQFVSADLTPQFPQGPENRAWIRLTTQKGLACYLDISRVSQGRITRAEIIGEKGQALADWTHGTVHMISSKDHTTQFNCPSKPTLVNLFKDFFQAVREDRPMPITGEDGLRAVEIADACYLASKVGHAVELG